MGTRDRTEESPTGGGRGLVGRVGDDPLIFILGMVTIGLVLGIFIGLLVGDAPDDAESSTEALHEDMEALSQDVLIMTAIVDELDARAVASAEGLAGARTRLMVLREDLVVVGSRLEELRVAVDQMEGPIEGARGDLDDLRRELAEVQTELVDLRWELEDLIARIIQGGGSGGNGGPVVPDNATLLPSPHLVHYRSPLLDPTCGMCHDVEPVGQTIISGSKMYWNGSLDDPGFNTVVDQTAECLECHGQFAETGMQPGYIDVSCVACHDDWADRMTATYVRESAIGEDDCLLCHGGANAFIDQPQKYST